MNALDCHKSTLQIGFSAYRFGCSDIIINQIVHGRQESALAILHRVSKQQRVALRLLLMLNIHAATVGAWRPRVESPFEEILRSMPN